MQTVVCAQYRSSTQKTMGNKSSESVVCAQTREIRGEHFEKKSVCAQTPGDQHRQRPHTRGLTVNRHAGQLQSELFDFRA